MFEIMFYKFGKTQDIFIHGTKIGLIFFMDKMQRTFETNIRIHTVTRRAVQQKRRERNREKKDKDEKQFNWLGKVKMAVKLKSQG